MRECCDDYIMVVLIGHYRVVFFISHPVAGKKNTILMLQSTIHLSLLVLICHGHIFQLLNISTQATTTEQHIHYLFVSGIWRQRTWSVNQWSVQSFSRGSAGRATQSKRGLRMGLGLQCQLLIVLSGGVGPSKEEKWNRRWAANIMTLKHGKEENGNLCHKNCKWSCSGRTLL